MPRRTSTAEVGMIFAMAAVMLLGIAAVVWWLWCWVAEQLWPGGPEGLLNPSYWTFLGVLVLFRVLKGFLLGGSK